MESEKIRGLIESIVSLLPKNGNDVKEDLKDNIKILLNDYLKKIDVVTREEFDIQWMKFLKQNTPYLKK